MKVNLTEWQIAFPNLACLHSALNGGIPTALQGSCQLCPVPYLCISYLYILISFPLRREAKRIPYEGCGGSKPPPYGVVSCVLLSLVTCHSSLVTSLVTCISVSRISISHHLTFD